MEAISSAQESQAVQPVTQPSPESTSSFDSGKFEQYLRSVLRPDTANEVSEEALFAGLIQERVSSLKGEESSKEFQALVDKHRLESTGASGVASEEDAARAALQEFQSTGKLTAEEASKIYNESFEAAQLDDKADALFDHLGGSGDPTIAMAQLDMAIKLAGEKLTGLADGKSTLGARDINEASTGWNYKFPDGSGGGTLGEAGLGSTSALSPDAAGIIQPNGTIFDGQKGFLFKPVTNNEGTLAVILPTDYLGSVSKVVLRDEAGTVIEEGRFTSTGDEGLQEKYAFSKQGGEYPANLTVEVQMNDGTTVSYAIPDPSQRYD